MGNSWNPQSWRSRFRKKISKHSRPHSLRVLVFEDTLLRIKEGGYQVKGKDIQVQKCTPQKSIFYDKPLSPLSACNEQKQCAVTVVNGDCLEVAETLARAGHSPLVLNMASFRNPGGGVTEGSGAQEENLCRRSNLHTSLFQYVDYAPHFGVPRNPEFSYPLDMESGAIYTPDVTVFKGSEAAGYPLLSQPYRVAVISVAAYRNPDLAQGNDELRLTEQYAELMKNKARVILRVAALNKHRTLVLSALGCGAYRNPPKHVAELFKTVIEEKEFEGYFDLITFAVIDDHNSRKTHNPEGNYFPFVEVFTAS